MSVHITENYYTCKNNAKNTFWKGFGMGVLGQLTGMGGYGMGGYGMGGYGMGGYGMGGYGMGGYGMSSIFNCGFGGYGMGYGFGNAWGMNDAYVGAQVGMMGLGVIFQGLSGYITEKKEAKAKAAETVATASGSQETLKSEIKTLEDEIKVLQAENTALGQTGLDDSGNVNEKAKSLFTKEASDYTNASSKVTTLETTKKDLETNKSIIEQKYPQMNGDSRNITDQQDKANYEQYCKDLAEINGTGEGSIAKAQKDKEAAAEALKEKVEEKVKANEKEIESKNKEIETKNQEFKKAQEQLEEIERNQLKQVKNYNKDSYQNDIKFKKGTDGNPIEEDGKYEIDDNNYDSEKFKKAFLWNFSRYCNATGKIKEQYAKEGLAIGAKIAENNDSNTDIRQKIKILESGGKIQWGA